jgi:hypothetical protein
VVGRRSTVDVKIVTVMIRHDGRTSSGSGLGVIVDTTVGGLSLQRLWHSVDSFGLCVWHGVWVLMRMGVWVWVRMGMWVGV